MPPRLRPPARQPLPTQRSRTEAGRFRVRRADERIVVHSDYDYAVFRLGAIPKMRSSISLACDRMRMSRHFNRSSETPGRMTVVARCVLYLFDSNLMLSVLAPFHHPNGRVVRFDFRGVLWFPAKLRVRICRNTRL